MMGLSECERISMMRSAVLTQSTRVTDGQTGRQTELAWHIRAIAYTLSRVKGETLVKNIFFWTFKLLTQIKTCKNEVEFYMSA